MPFVLHCAKACKASQVIFLEYSLAPEHRYPVQLVQIVTALRYLLEKTGLRPEDIILAGDSAGGHLIASLLAHIVRPSPYAPRLNFQKGEQFRAVVFVSPFVDLGTGHVSFENNVRTDYLDAKSAQVLIGHFRPEYDDVWGNICDGQGAEEVWDQVFSGGGIVKRGLVTAGGGEVLLDGIRRFGTDFVGSRTVVVDRGVDVRGLGNMDFALVEAVGEAHVQPALDSFLGYYEGSMMRGIVAFLESV
jgi:acetyl esterase/lipase